MKNRRRAENPCAEAYEDWWGCDARREVQRVFQIGLCSPWAKYPGVQSQSDGSAPRESSGLEPWKAILERLPKARFLLGQGKCGFWVSFEALCEHVRIRLLEGDYDHVPGKPKSAKPAAISDVSIERWRQRVKNRLSASRAALEPWPAS